MNIFGMKKGYVAIIALMILFTSCNQEVVSIKGMLKGYKNTTVELKLKGKSGKEKIISAETEVKNEKFDVDMNGIKPPCKITLVLKDKREVSCWVFRYGKFNFELNTKDITDVKINDSFENSELTKVKETYDNMYLRPLKEQ